jgi:hypothetical protein
MNSVIYKSHTKIVTPYLLQKCVSENFLFPCDVMTSLDWRFGSGIFFFFFKNLGM